MRLASSLILLVASLPFLVISDCFFPNGKNDSGLFPCFPDAEASHCCRGSDVCLTNGLCFSPGLGTVVRRGCTDSTWKDKACLDACTSLDRFSSTDAVLTWCGSYGGYCCGDDKAARDCCDNVSNETLSVPVSSGEVICAGRPNTGDPPEPITSSSSSSSTVATSTCQAVPSSTSTKSLKTARNALIGVAATLGAFLIVAAAFVILLWKSRDNERERKRALERNNAALGQDKAQLEQDKAALARDKTQLEDEKKKLFEMAQRMNEKLPPPLREPLPELSGAVNGHANGGPSA